MANSPNNKNGHQYPIKNRALKPNGKDGLIVIRKDDPFTVHDVIREKNEERQIESISKAIDSLTDDPEKLAIFEKALKKSKLSKSQLFANALNFRARDRLLDPIWQDPNRITVQDSDGGENARITIGKDGNGEIRVVFYERRGNHIKVNEHRHALDDELVIYHHGR